MELTKGDEQKGWTLEIRPKRSLFRVNLKEVVEYKDLLWLLVRRDFVSLYKQTILGPLWFFIQPVLTTVVFTIVFGNIANISTDGLPKPVFYLAGVVAWSYFAECFNKTAGTFTTNAGLFGKVYFPRIIVPLSVVITNLFKFGIQFLLLLAILAWYLFNGAAIHPNGLVFLTPVLLLIMAGLGLGFGMIISALTAKYRDLKFLVGFGVQLLMYGTPVVYPLSEVQGSQFEWLIWLNPMTAVIETFKYGYLGAGIFSWLHLAYSFGFMVLLFVAGVLWFNKVEQNFMDTV